jgi:hypothetical protein
MNDELHFLRLTGKPDIFCQFYVIGCGGLIDSGRTDLTGFLRPVRSTVLANRSPLSSLAT